MPSFQLLPKVLSPIIKAKCGHRAVASEHGVIDIVQATDQCRVFRNNVRLWFVAALDGMSQDYRQQSLEQAVVRTFVGYLSDGLRLYAA